MEYRLCREFEESIDDALKGFWCDGVSWFPNDIELNKKHVNDNRKIITKAWIGKTGQDVYQMTLIFGRKALSRYAKDGDLTDCIPDADSNQEWIEIDIDKKTISIQLT